MIVKQLTALLGFKVDQASVNQANSSMENIVDVAKRAAMAFGVFKTFQFFSSLGEQVAQLGDQFDEMSRRTKVSVQTLQAWAFGAETTGASLGDLEVALKTLSRTAVDAGNGSKETADAYSRLGVKVKNADGTIATAEELFIGVAQGLSGMEDESLKTATALKVLGKNGQMLLPMLEGGAQGLDDLMTKAKDLGVVMDEDLIQMTREYDDVADENKASIQGLKNAMGKHIIPPLIQAKRRMTEWIKANKEWIAQGFGTWLERLGGGLVRVRQFILDVASGMATWAKSLDPLSKKFLAIGVTAAIVAALLALPGGILLLLAGIIMLIIDDFQTWREGGKSVIGDMIKWFEDLINTIPGLGGALKAIGTVVSAVFKFLADIVNGFFAFFAVAWNDGWLAAFKFLWDAWSGAVWGLIDALWPVLTAIWDNVSTLFSELGSWIATWAKNVWKPIGEWFSDTWNGIVNGLTSALKMMGAFISQFVDKAIAFYLWPFKKVYAWVSKLFGKGKGGELESELGQPAQASPGAGGATAGAGAGGGWPEAQAPQLRVVPLVPPERPAPSFSLRQLAGLSRMATAGPTALYPQTVSASPAKAPMTLAPQTSIDVSVQATPGMDEEALARAVARHVDQATENQYRAALQALTPAAAAAGG